MKKTTVKTKSFLLVGIAGMASVLALHAITPAELAVALANGAKLTIVDVRSNGAYQKSHIPGAINIPAALCSLKELPPLGRVVVYDDGFGQDKLVEQAAAALSVKPGIRVDILEGGFAAWRSYSNQIAADRGIVPEEFPMITYEQLKAAAPDKVVLVDLRTPRGSTQVKGSGTSESMTDLRKEFPNMRIVKSPFTSPSPAIKEAREGPFLVLIDRNDGRAEETARLLKAQGIRRFAILLGGEEMLARKGRTGLQRSGAVVSVAGVPSADSSQNRGEK